MVSNPGAETVAIGLRRVLVIPEVEKIGKLIYQAFLNVHKINPASVPPVQVNEGVIAVVELTTL